MAIIVSKNGNNAQKIDESHFDLEDNLQEYVKNNPDIIPIYEINDGARLLILSREFGTQSGPIDALGVDQEGNVYVIETKLYRNSDKRTVIAQALDYGASLWKHSGDATEFIEILNSRVKAQFGISLPDKLQDFFDTDEVQPIIDSMTSNISNGVIKFVILMDSVEDRLKDLVTYVNRNSKFDIYAVDLEYYKHDEFEIVIPKIYGSEVKKDVSVKDDSHRIDNQKIINWVEEFAPSWLSIDHNRTNKTFIRFTSDNLDRVLPPRNDNDSSWGNGNAYYYELRLDRDGSVKLFLSLNSVGLNEIQRQAVTNIIARSSRTPKNPDWQWFRANKWEIDHNNGDDALRNSLMTAITEDIPSYEKQLVS